MADSIFNNTTDILFYATNDIYWTRAIPIVTTQAVTAIEDTSMEGNGTITDLGGINSDEAGFCFIQNTTGDPTTSDSHVSEVDSFGLGVFNQSIPSLTTGKNYRVRAFAINSEGTGYGETVSVITDLVLSDSVTLTDSNIKSVLQLLSDAVNLTDDNVKNTVQTLTDSINLSDANENNTSKPLADNINLTDDNIKSVIQSLADNISLTDSDMKSVIQSLADNISLTDSNVKNTVMPLTDNISLADSNLKNITQILSDNITVSDLITAKSFIKSLSDIVTFVDSTEKGLTYNLDDTFNLSDAIQNNFTLPLNDSITLTDNLVNFNITVCLADAIVFRDSYRRNFIYHLNDILRITDYFRIVEHEAVGKIWRDAVLIASKVKQVLASVKVREITPTTRIRQVLCVPIHRQKEEEMLEFSPKQSYEEYYAVFNFAKVITPSTVISTTEVVVYDESGTVVTSTLTDDTKLTVVGAKVYVWVRNGSEQTYKITCKIVMDNGEKFEQDAELEVTEV